MPTIDSARRVARYAWGPINNADTLIRGRVWSFSTPQKGGLVAAYPWNGLPDWATHTKDSWYHIREKGHEYKFVAFECDIDWAILMYHDEDARQAQYKKWHPENQTYEEHTKFITDFYNRHHLKE